MDALSARKSNAPPSAADNNSLLSRTVSKMAFWKGDDDKPQAPNNDMLQRCRDFAERYRIPQRVGVDPLSSILMYLPDKLHENEARIRAQDLETRQLRESTQMEIDSLTERKEKYRTDLEKAHRQVELMKRDWDRDRLPQEATQAKLQSSQELASQLQASLNEQIKHNEQLKARLRALEEENEGLYKAGEQKIRELQTPRSLVIVEKDRQFGEKEKALRDEIVKLQNRIAAYGVGNFHMVSDEAFQAKLQALAQQISNLVRYVPRPDARNFDASLDPTHFLNRNEKYLGNQIWPKFIRALCWGVLTRGFFGYPLGFGIFGTQGGGYSILSHIYESFAVLDPTANRVTLPNNKSTNEARGFLFERIWTDVTSTAGVSTVDGKGTTLRVKGFTTYFHQQVERVTAELVSKLTRCSANTLDLRAPLAIRDVVHDVGLLALEMATQRSHVTLQFCAHGETVQAGDLFRDENASEGDGAGMVRVDLMIEPALLRLGNGREDLTSRRVLSKGGLITLKK